MAKALNPAYNQLSQASKCSTADVIIVILNDENAQMSGSLKRYVECELGINTLFVTRGKIKDKRGIHQSILNGLALKHNVKLGGQNHTVMKAATGGSFLSAFQDLGNDTIVVDADVVPSVASRLQSQQSLQAGVTPSTSTLDLYVFKQLA